MSSTTCPAYQLGGCSDTCAVMPLSFEDAMEHDLAETLITAEQLHARNAELAATIHADYEGKPLTVVIISNGALIFASDLVRHLPIPLQLDVIAAKSYVGARSSGEVTIRNPLHVPVKDRHVLVVDDIFDSGLTLETICENVASLQPVSIKTCVLLCKNRPRTTSTLPDYVSFPIDDQFVVGYGLDYEECYRNLPYIGVLHPHLYQ